MPDIAHRRVGIMQSGLQIDDITLPWVHSVTFIRYRRYVTLLSKTEADVEISSRPWTVPCNVKCHSL